MSLIVSLHSWEGIGRHWGTSIWSLTVGVVTLTITTPHIERIMEMLEEPA